MNINIEIFFKEVRYLTELSSLCLRRRNAAVCTAHRYGKHDEYSWILGII